MPGVGGTEKAVLGLASAMKEMGKDVVVRCPNFDNHDDSVFNFPVLRCKSVKISPNDVCAFPALSRKFKKQLKDFAPDIIHCNTVSPMTAFALKYAKKCKKKPAVIVDYDVKAFADKIIYLLQHKDELKQAGENAEKMIPKDWRQTAVEYLEEYRKLLLK